MGIKCEILLKTPNKGIYESGELVNGSLRYSVDKAIACEYIIVFFQGKLKGKHFWTETNQNLISKEVFVSLHKTIFQGEHHIIEVGEYEEEFEFLLPINLPSTFRNKSCTISYKILADMKLSGFFGGIKQFEKEIQVQGDVEPSLDQHLVYGLTKTPFPSRKPIDLEVEINKKLINAGDNISLNYAIYNEADIPVTGIRTKLVAETTYKYDSKKKKVQRKTVNQSVVESPGVKEDSEAKFSCIVPTLPNLHSIQHSKYFKRDYKVVVTASFPFPHTDSSVEIPIVISATKFLIIEES